MNSIINKVRNSLESKNMVEPLLNFVTNNKFYRQYIFKEFLKKSEAVRKSKNYSFAIEVSSFCNARCYFCPNKWMKRKKNIMNMAVFQKIVERIKEEKINPRQFNLTGTGEPLTDRMIFKKIELLKSNFPESEVFFPTNLALANKNILSEIVKSKLDSISISLNADNEKDYKEIMNLNFHNTINNLNNLIDLRNKQKSKLKIYITIAANPINKSGINKFLGKWEKLVDGVIVNWIHNWAGAFREGKRKSKVIARYPCRSLYEQIIIQSNGNIPLCCVDFEGKVIGGNVGVNKILDSFYADNIDRIREIHKKGDINKIEMCSQCRFSERGLYWLV